MSFIEGTKQVVKSLVGENIVDALQGDEFSGWGVAGDLAQLALMGTGIGGLAKVAALAKTGVKVLKNKKALDVVKGVASGLKQESKNVMSQMKAGANNLKENIADKMTMAGKKIDDVVEKIPNNVYDIPAKKPTMTVIKESLGKAYELGKTLAKTGGKIALYNVPGFAFADYMNGKQPDQHEEQLKIISDRFDKGEITGEQAFKEIVLLKTGKDIDSREMEKEKKQIKYMGAYALKEPIDGRIPAQVVSDEVGLSWNNDNRDLIDDYITTNLRVKLSGDKGSAERNIAIGNLLVAMKDDPEEFQKFKDSMTSAKMYV